MGGEARHGGHTGGRPFAGKNRRDFPPQRGYDELKTEKFFQKSLNKNGFLGKYKRFSNGFHYCYSKADNKMYLVDEEDIIIDSSLTKELDSGGIDSSKNEFAPVLVTKLTNKLK